MPLRVLLVPVNINLPIHRRQTGSFISCVSPNDLLHKLIAKQGRRKSALFFYQLSGQLTKFTVSPCDETVTIDKSAL
jgi:hypothetical protein